MCLTAILMATTAEWLLELFPHSQPNKSIRHQRPWIVRQEAPGVGFEPTKRGWENLRISAFQVSASFMLAKNPAFAPCYLSQVDKDDLQNSKRRRCNSRLGCWSLPPL